MLEQDTLSVTLHLPLQVTENTSVQKQLCGFHLIKCLGTKSLRSKTIIMAKSIICV